MRDLPRLVYVGDVPVEASQHGSALMFRALEDYPAEQLRIVETGVASQSHRRLPGVAYSAVPIGNRRWLNSRVHGPYSAWLTATARGYGGRVASALADFRPEAVVTVGHGYGWLTAAAVAERLGVRLHLIVHDDWPRVSAIAVPLRGWLDRRFGEVYRMARTRLCISPFMSEIYQQRYGAAGSVMYPSRSNDAAVFAPRAPRSINGRDPIVVGYGGNSGPEMMSCLRDLAGALPNLAARVEVFGPFDEPAKAELLALSPAFTFHGFVPYGQMIAGLRETADVLFVPMTFEPGDRDNMSVSFPSKLADYTATGLPLLAYAPAYSSAARWARAHGDVAAVVDRRGAAPLRQALAQLKSDPDGRGRLAQRASEVGAACFGPDAARRVLHAALAVHGD